MAAVKKSNTPNRSTSTKKNPNKKSTVNKKSDVSRKRNVSRKSPAKKKADIKHKNAVNEDIILIITLAISILLILSSINLCGPVGEGINYIVFGLIGVIGYVFPFILFFGIAFYLANRGNRTADRKIVAFTVLVFALTSLIQIINGYDSDISMLGYFDTCGKNEKGGGIIGSVFLKIIYKNFGSLATVVILIAIILICFMLITGKTLVTYIRGAGQSRIRQKIDDIRERRLERNDYDYDDEDEDELEENEKQAGKRSAKIVNLKKNEDQDTENNIEDQVAIKEPESFVDVLKTISKKGKKNKLKNTVNSDKENNNIEQVIDNSKKAIIVDMQEILPETNSRPSITGSYISSDGGLSSDNRVDGGISDGRGLVKSGNVANEDEQSKGVSIYEEELMRKFGENNSRYFDDSVKSDGLKTSFDDTSNHMIHSDTEHEDLYSNNEKLNEQAVKELTSDETDALNALINETKADAIAVNDTDKSTDIKQSSIISTDNIAATASMNMLPIPEPEKPYVFPPIDLLGKPPSSVKKMTEKELKTTAHKLESTLESFGVKVFVTNVSCGPAVTRYELQPEQGVKVSRITALTDDIKLNLAASDIRIEAPISGKAAVGIEVPNKEVSSVYFRELIEHKDFKNHSSDIAFAVGKDISGQVVVTDIGKMPHLLIAGATGSGKSVCINTLIMSILYKSKPSDVKLIMIDPKVVELSVYNGIPHLLYPVVTDPKQASDMLNWAVMEMTDRYAKFADLSVRDLKGYNAKVEELKSTDDVEDIEPKKHNRLPQIVIIVDELADLMMTASKEVETAICRLAQMARAAGMHLIIATQRPSVNVITGVIKANVPSRIAFSVSSAIDSRTIIDGSGAETLLGKGDMLFFPSGIPKPVRVQGAFVSDKEVSSVVEFLKEQNESANYNVKINEYISSAVQQSDSTNTAINGGANGRDDYFAEAGRFIIEKQKASIGMLQRVYKIGFNRAARIMDQLFEAGVVGPEEGTKPRKILMTMEEFEQFIML